MLPAVRTNEEWEAVVWNESLIRPAAEDLAARLGLPAAGLRLRELMAPPERTLDSLALTWFGTA